MRLKQEIAKISLITLAIIAILSVIGAVTLLITSAKAQAVYYGNQSTDTDSTSIALNDPTYKAAIKFTAQESKTVAKVYVYICDYGTSPTYEIGLQADSSGNPSGSYLSTPGTFTPTGLDWDWEVGDIIDCAITAGEIYHIVIQPSGTPNGTDYSSLRKSRPFHQKLSYNSVLDSNLNTLDYSISTSGAWTALDYQPIYILEYSDAATSGNSYAVASTISIHSNVVSDDTDDIYQDEVFTASGGNRTVTAVDCYVKQNSATEPSGDLLYELYDMTNSISMVSGTFCTAADTTTAYQWITKTFGSAQTLSDGNQYYLRLKSPQSDSTNYYHWNMPHSDLSSAPYDTTTYDGNTGAYRRYSSDSGATWTTNDYQDGTFRFTLGGAIKIIIQKWRELYQ